MLHRRVLGIAAFGVLALGLAEAIASCGSTSAAGLAENCSINSDCNSPLVCAFSHCHNACMVSSDCPLGARCVMSGTAGVCQLPAESTCMGTTTCQSGEVCGTDKQCRATCSVTAPCTVGDYCLPSGSSSACYSKTNPTDELALIAAGYISADGAVLVDASTGGIGPDGSSSGGGPDGSSGGPDAGAHDSSGTVNSCASPQTAFGSTAQGDSNPNFTSGVGVRVADKFLIFSGYAGGAGDVGDAGDAGMDNLVYVQAFDPTTANSLGSAQPLFTAPNGTGFALESASVAPTGQIALAFNYGGDFYYQNGASLQTSLYAAFLGTSADAGPSGMALQRTVALVSGEISGQPHVIWSAATGAFVFSWEYVVTPNNSNITSLGTQNFTPNGGAAGGTTPVPTDNSSATVQAASSLEQGSVAAGPNLFGVAFQQAGNANAPWLTILDLKGSQVGSAVQVGPRGPSWVTVAASTEGFVYIYDGNGNAPSEAFVPTSGDAGVVLPDAGYAGLAGFTFAGGAAIDVHAIGDDTGGIGGVGAAMLYSTGLSFAYVNADGTTHVGPSSVLPNTYAAGDQINIMNFGGSFGLSLYSAAMHSTQMAASGCTP